MQINYLVKYIELFDTVFLAVKKKPLTLLHCWHHGATVALCYIQLRGYTAVVSPFPPSPYPPASLQPAH